MPLQFCKCEISPQTQPPMPKVYTFDRRECVSLLAAKG